jgi:hypothetical protein
VANEPRAKMCILFQFNILPQQNQKCKVFEDLFYKEKSSSLSQFGGVGYNFLLFLHFWI